LCSWVPTFMKWLYDHILGWGRYAMTDDTNTVVALKNFY
jgi:hypothetical protein